MRRIKRAEFQYHHETGQKNAGANGQPAKGAGDKNR